MAHRKPTGVNGPLKITGGDSPNEFQQLRFPEEKSEIESMIFEGAVGAGTFLGLHPYSSLKDFSQDQENSFDFKIPGPKGIEFVDLVEFVSFDSKRPGYAHASSSSSVGDMADSIYNVIDKKAKRYGIKRKARVHLLLYCTDFKFFPSQSVVDLLKLYCHRRHHGFRSVVFYAPIVAKEGVLFPLFPLLMDTDIEQIAKHELQIRARVLKNLDPQKAQDIPSGIIYDLKN